MSGNHRELVFLSVLAFCWALASRFEAPAGIPQGLADQPLVARANAAPTPRAAGTATTRQVYTTPILPPSLSTTAGDVGRQAPQLAMNNLTAVRR